MSAYANAPLDARERARASAHVPMLPPEHPRFARVLRRINEVIAGAGAKTAAEFCRNQAEVYDRVLAEGASDENFEWMERNGYSAFDLDEFSHFLHARANALDAGL